MRVSLRMALQELDVVVVRRWATLARGINEGTDRQQRRIYVATACLVTSASLAITAGGGSSCC